MATVPNKYRVGVTPRQEYVELDWNTEKPTKPGWYWVIKKWDRFIPIPTLIEVMNSSAGGVQLVRSDDYSFDDFIFWLGPLPKPDVP